jgi:hypothetical protein
MVSSLLTCCLLFILEQSAEPEQPAVPEQSAEPAAESYAFSADINQLLSLSKYLEYSICWQCDMLAMRQPVPLKINHLSQHNSHQHVLLQQGDFPPRAHLQRE